MVVFHRWQSSQSWAPFTLISSVDKQRPPTVDILPNRHKDILFDILTHTDKFQCQNAETLKFSALLTRSGLLRYDYEYLSIGFLMCKKVAARADCLCSNCMIIYNSVGSMSLTVIDMHIKCRFRIPINNKSFLAGIFFQHIYPIIRG